MGNANSQAVPNPIEKSPLEKVLPIGTTAILRPTQNGEILQAGGTLSKTKRETYKKFYGSEPDLRTESKIEKKTSNNRPKKYRAPPRPSEKNPQTKRSGLYKTREETKTDQISMKKFYFGMDRADSSSDSETETNKISLRLRPNLPKKRLEIPRFSPGSAWKLLKIEVESEDAISEHEDLTLPDLRFLEAKIRDRSEMAYFQEKSADSGISGDDSPKVANRYGNEKSWTPQQDLGNDSSAEDASSSTPSFGFAQKPHVFSLSLPRDRDLKRSFSELRVPELFDANTFPNSNWFLSKSAPNSLNNGFNSLNNGFNSLEECSRGRIMYLPAKIEEKSVSNSKKNQKKFSFQNTIRQIERRKLAEKLGKEAEIKEKQRLEEIEAMRRIEEEFERKRLMHRL